MTKDQAEALADTVLDALNAKGGDLERLVVTPFEGGEGSWFIWVDFPEDEVGPCLASVIAR